VNHPRPTSIVIGLILTMIGATASAQVVARDDLAAALREGGYVIVMRHASAPRALPDETTANPDNVNRERQLDEAGRRDATAMGAALRDAEIPVSEVLSSPTYRAVETGRRMGMSDIRLVDELSNEGMRESGEALAEWLRANVEMPPVGGNRLLITHGPNVSGAFPDDAAGMEEGEALIFQPAGDANAMIVARLRITDWADL
jgi:phosphohistidine phosphatase SixA